MARQTREEKTIEHGELIVEDLKRLYTTDSEAYKEYKKLFEEYKKISKRFSKTLTMNDAVGKNVIIDNEQLKENVTYTVKKARDKILYNIEEHRKTKEVLAKHSQTDKEVINTLRVEILDLKKNISNLESQLNRNDEVHHQFEETSIPKVKSKDINHVDIKNLSYQSILTKQIASSQHNHTHLTVAKLTIDDFKTKIKLLNSDSSDSNTIIKVLHKFFTIGLSSKNIVYYYADNIFYLIFPNHNCQETKEFIEKINVPRRLSNITFTFSIGITQCKEDDTFDSLEERLNKAHIEASKDLVSNSSYVLWNNVI